MNLPEFLQRQQGFDGPWNCSTMPADWCMALGHPDFAAAWRHVVDRRCEVAGDGGLTRLWEEGIADRLPVVADLIAGDIAVITAIGFEAGAIWTGDRWALQKEGGLLFPSPSRVAIVRAWRP